MVNISNILLHFNIRKEGSEFQTTTLAAALQSQTQPGLHLLAGLRADKMSNRAVRPADLEERRKRRKRAEMIEKIPVLAGSGASKNRNLMKLRGGSLLFAPPHSSAHIFPD